MDSTLKAFVDSHCCAGFACRTGLDDRTGESLQRRRGRNIRIKAEYTLYDSILKDANPKTKLDKLQEWQTKYATTEFEKQRKALFLIRTSSSTSRKKRWRKPS